MNAGENIKLVIETTIVELVEDLHPDKSIKHHGRQLFFLFWIANIVVPEDLLAGEVEDKCDGELEDCLADDHFPHIHSDEGGLFACWLTVKDLFSLLAYDFCYVSASRSCVSRAGF